MRVCHVRVFLCALTMRLLFIWCAFFAAEEVFVWMEKVRASWISGNPNMMPDLWCAFFAAEHVFVWMETVRTTCISENPKMMQDFFSLFVSAAFCYHRRWYRRFCWRSCWSELSTWISTTMWSLPPPAWARLPSHPAALRNCCRSTILPPLLVNWYSPKTYFLRLIVYPSSSLDLFFSDIFDSFRLLKWN